MKKRKECELINKNTGAKALEEQQRQEGLEKAIDCTNKGFSLLQKMGYKPGSGIGKNSKCFCWYFVKSLLHYVTFIVSW